MRMQQGEQGQGADPEMRADEGALGELAAGL